MNQRPATLDELEYRVRMLEINMDDRVETVITMRQFEDLCKAFNQMQKEIFPNRFPVALAGKIIHVGPKGPKKPFWELPNGQPKWWAKPFKSK